MTSTTISSQRRTVTLGFDQPFVVIGERINPTGRRLLAEQMKAGDYSRVQEDALAQVAAGAQVLDVNAGIPLADEPRILAECIRLLQSVTDVPLCIDSSVVEALEAGLAAYQGKALLNSVTGEEERLERVLPLVRKYGCAVIAISNDETGISEDVDVRFDVARRIVERAQDHGIPVSDVVVDPLVMPVGAVNTAGRQVLRLVRRLREELGVNTTCGASNLSFGLPNRNGLNAAFISMAIGAGMTSAITNPLHPELMQAVRGANVVMGHDPQCAAWVRSYRESQPEAAEGRGRRTGRRRRDGGDPGPAA
jgi:5-methyltetrahydrofolate--homocysteine methyltransferase